MPNCPLLSLPTSLLRYTLGFLVPFSFSATSYHQWIVLSRVHRYLDVKRWAHTLSIDFENALTCCARNRYAMTHRLHSYMTKMIHLTRIAILTNLNEYEVDEEMDMLRTESLRDDTRTREILEIHSRIEVLHMEFPMILRVHPTNSLRILHLEKTDPRCLEGLYLPHLSYCYIWDHQVIKSFDMVFAPNLQHLSLHGLVSLRRVHRLPESLKTLDLCDVGRLRIEKWPIHLHKLVLELMEHVKLVIPIINGLKEIIIGEYVDESIVKDQNALKRRMMADYGDSDTMCVCSNHGLRI